MLVCMQTEICNMEKENRAELTIAENVIKRRRDVLKPLQVQNDDAGKKDERRKRSKLDISDILTPSNVTVRKKLVAQMESTDKRSFESTRKPSSRQSAENSSTEPLDDNMNTTIVISNHQPLKEIIEKLVHVLHAVNESIGMLQSTDSENVAEMKDSEDVVKVVEFKDVASTSRCNLITPPRLRLRKTYKESTPARQAANGVASHWRIFDEELPNSSSINFEFSKVDIDQTNDIIEENEEKTVGQTVKMSQQLPADQRTKQTKNDSSIDEKVGNSKTDEPTVKSKSSLNEKRTTVNEKPKTSNEKEEIGIPSTSEGYCANGNGTHSNCNATEAAGTEVENVIANEGASHTELNSVENEEKSNTEMDVDAENPEIVIRELTTSRCTIM